ncbi:hypothetical protein [Actinomadura sp. GTD37]|uniref:hypothetical protein n=1 Tax=Actinomadura sp. GTD37 TaxID=1778030 RepID=UPI0035C13E3A
MEIDQPARVARIRRGADVGVDAEFVIEYTVDGKPTGRGFARAGDLDTWCQHLREGGWTIQGNEGETPVA